VEGLSFTGFNTDKAFGWGADSTKCGLWMTMPVQCVVRECTAFLNSAGLMLSMEGEGGSNIIEHCVAYGNYSALNGEGCNIQVLGPNFDTIRDCYGYLGRDHNISMYGRVKHPERPSWIQNCLAWGAWLDIQQKSGGSHNWQTEQSMAFNCLRSRTVRHCAFGRVDGPGSPDSFNLNQYMASRNAEFADPDNLDFRPQSTSRLRGQGTNGTDLGAFQYQSNIFYVAISGDDTADGLSVDTAWKTLVRAIPSLKSGDTLYLEPGTYAGSPVVAVERVTIRGRGVAPVTIAGPFALERCVGLGLERLNLSGPVTDAASRATCWKNCTFAGFQAQGVEGLRLEHAVCTTAPELKDCTGVYLSGNIYAAGLQADPAGILYSDYNSYADEAALKAMPDRYSQIIRPELEYADGVPVVMNGQAFGGRGPRGTALGPYHEFRKKAFPLAGPFVHSVSATTANLEWWTSQPALTEIAWGDTADCIHTQQLNTGCYNTFSLSELQPGKTYYLRIQSITVPPNTAFAQIMEGIAGGAPVVEFQTTTTMTPPQTYYVAPDGRVENTGLSREQAWPTIGQAAGNVNAGDTVLIAAGKYKEIVQIQVTGDQDRPITYKSLPGEKVILDGDNRSLGHAFNLRGVNCLVFDGLYFTGHGYGAAMEMSACRNIQVRRCFFKNEGAIRARNCSNLLIENCVIGGAMEGVNLQGCQNTRYEHNVSFVHLIMHGQIIGGKTYCSGNIFTDNQLYKLRVPMFILNRTETLVESNNCYFLRLPDAQRKMFQFYSYVKPPRRYGLFSLADYYEDTGRDGQSLFCDPQFQGLVGVEIPPYKGVVEQLWSGLTVTPIIQEAVGDGMPGFPPDRMPAQSDFNAFFATNPEVTKRGIGLQPEAFAEFDFDQPAWK
jgi:hypothetical protein